MSWKLTKGRVAVAAAFLIVAISLGSNASRIARATATLINTPHAQSKIVPHILGKPLTVTIESPYYHSTSQVSYAQVQDPLGNTLGFWAPVKSATGPPIVVGQSVQSNRITVKLDTSILYTKAPIPGGPVPPVVPGTPPSLGSGSIIVISTNVDGDIPPVDPIMIETVQITY